MNIIISLLDDKFINYAIAMFKSFQKLNKNIPMFAGSINLSIENIKRLKKINVNVLESKTRFYPKHLCMCDLTLIDYLEDIKFDKVMWIDSDTIITRNICNLFEMNYDYIGHPGDCEIGESCFLDKNRSNLKRIEINKELKEFGKFGNHYAMGLWVCSNKNLLFDFKELILKNPNAHFEGDICSELINSKYTHYQLNGYEWSIRSNNKKLKIKDKKICFDDIHFPYTIAFARDKLGNRYNQNIFNKRIF